jgi:hypothetical protein
MFARWLGAVCLLAACAVHNPRYRVTSDRDATVGDGMAGVVMDGAGDPDSPVGGAGPGLDALTDTISLEPADGDAVVNDATAGSDQPDNETPGMDAAIDSGAPEAPQPEVAPLVDLAPDVFTPPAGCGTATANLTGINDADGVVVDTDGIVYFLTDDSTDSYVGRILPGQKPDVTWLKIVDSPTTWGLALDSVKKRIYVLVVDGGGALVAFDDITGTPNGFKFVVGIDNGNDVVVAADGTVFYSQQGDRHIYSVPRAGGTPTRVTTTAIGTSTAKPAGLAVTASGELLVGVENNGPIYKLTLANGRETARVPLNGWMGWANGLTFDRAGRLYVSIYHDSLPRSVVRLDQDGTATPILMGGRYSSIAFGRGGLDCRDLYVADPFGRMQVVRVADSLY